MSSDSDQLFSSETSPVGWYVGSYLLRFVELNEIQMRAFWSGKIPSSFRLKA